MQNNDRLSMYVLNTVSYYYMAITRNGDVKEITIQDETEKMTISIWRSASIVDVPLGSQMSIWDSPVAYNTFHKRNVVNVNMAMNVHVSYHCTVYTVHYIRKQQLTIYNYSKSHGNV